MDITLVNIPHRVSRATYGIVILPLIFFHVAKHDGDMINSLSVVLKRTVFGDSD